MKSLIWIYRLTLINPLISVDSPTYRTICDVRRKTVTIAYFGHYKDRLTVSVDIEAKGSMNKALIFFARKSLASTWVIPDNIFVYASVRQLCLNF